MNTSEVRRVGGGRMHLAWAPASAPPADDAWLTPAEAAILGRFRFSKRAADWRLGRWVAKEAVAEALGGEASGGSAHAPGRTGIEVLAGPGGGPRARILASGGWPRVSVSLSHSAGTGFAVAAIGDARIGCDIEEIAPRSDGFVEDYFTAEEAAWVRAGGDERDARAILVWSAKESALKALGEGLRMDTRRVVVEVERLARIAGDAWKALAVVTVTGESFAGWWRVAGGLAWTVVG